MEKWKRGNNIRPIKLDDGTIKLDDGTIKLDDGTILSNPKEICEIVKFVTFFVKYFFSAKLMLQKLELHVNNTPCGYYWIILSKCKIGYQLANAVL